jgi:hypothetical protein
MPVTVNHALTATTPDNTSYEIRPSHWNSAHAFTLNATGSEISGAFSNANGFSFGLSAGAITGSHNGLTTAAQSNHSHGNPTLALTNLSGTTGSASSGLTLSLSAASQTNQSIGLYASSNTTGQSSSSTVDARSLSFRGIGIASVGISAGQVLISVPSAGGSVNFSAGTTSNNLNAVTFSNSNGMSFGLNGSVITGSYTTPDVGTVSAGTSIATLGQIILSDSNGLSFGANGNTITASYVPFGAGISGGNTAGNSGTVSGRVFFAGGANITLSGSSNGVSETISIVGGAGGSINLSAGTTSNNVTNFVLSNSNGVSFGLNGSTVTASHNGLTSQSNQAASAANGSFAFQTLSFSNLNGISFGTSAGSAITASHNALTTARASSDAIGLNTAQTNVTWTVNSSGLSINAGGYAGTASGFTGANISGSITHNTQGLSLSLSVAAPGAAAENNAFNLLGANTAGNTTATGSTIGLSGVNLTLSGTNASQIVFSVPAVSSLSATGQVSISVNGSTISIGVPGGTQSFWSPFPDAQTTGSQIGQGSVFVQPMAGLGGNVSLSRFDVLASMSISSSTNSSHAGALSFGVGIYTRTGSTLSLATSGSQSYQWTNTSNNSLGSLSGVRRFSVPVAANITAGADYWIGVSSRSATSNANWFTASNVRASAATDLIQGLIGEASNQTKQVIPGHGLWSTTSTALPSSIALGDIRGHGSGVANNGLPVFVNGVNFTA